MPYSPTTWVDNVTLGNQTRMNNLETQFTEATQSFEQDLFTPFVFSGLVCTIDGSIANQLDVTAGVAFPKQTDSTLRRRATSASTPGQFTTSTPSTTYYLDLNPDGTFSWATSHSGVTNYLTICSATTNSGGNLLVVTDARALTTSFLQGGLILNGLSLAAGKIFRTANTASGGGVTGKFELSDPDNTTIYLDLLADKMRLVTNYLGGATQVLWQVTTQTGALSLDSGKLLTDGMGTVSGAATAAPGAPTLALASGTALGIGVYDYKVTYTSALGESALGTLAAITTTTGNQDVNLTAIPTGPYGTTGRNLYRTKVGGSTYYLLHSIADNTTTTYSDTTADASLTTVAPVHPSLGGDIWKSSGGATVAQVFSDGALSFDSGAISSDGAGNLAALAVDTTNPIFRSTARFNGPSGDYSYCNATQTSALGFRWQVAGTTQMHLTSAGAVVINGSFTYGSGGADDVEEVWTDDAEALAPGDIACWRDDEAGHGGAIARCTHDDCPGAGVISSNPASVKGGAAVPDPLHPGEWMRDPDPHWKPFTAEGRIPARVTGDVSAYAPNTPVVSNGDGTLRAWRAGDRWPIGVVVSVRSDVLARPLPTGCALVWVQ